MVVIKVTIIALFILLRCTQHGLAQTICTSANTCDDCLQRSPGCIWCNQTYFDQSARCFLMDDRGNCSTDNLVIIPGSLNLSNRSLSQNVLVSPQSVQIKLRLGEPQSFQIAVRAGNAPLDLYFLVDQSTSMVESLDTFKTLVGELFNAIENITSNSLVGMGLFVDKPIAPYISENPLELIDPCGQNIPCRSPYGFMHIMQLTNDADEFQRILNEQVISGNLDDPECGLDAILQAVVCEDIIGWRQDSLRILMHISDAQIHVAGDGLLAGIVNPAVPECRLQQNGSSYFYNGTIIYDYPSLAMIRELLNEKLITLVFGVVLRDESLDDTGNDRRRNEQIQNFIESIRSELPQSLVQLLLNDSSNIIKAVENAYREITTNITLQVNAPDGIDVTFVPGCPENDGRSCMNVGVDQVVKFNVTVTASSCDNVFIRNGSIFNIDVRGYGNVEVDFEGICSCECSEMIETNSTQCSDVGDLRCGSCICPIDRDGINCECNENNAASENCNMNERSGEICSGPERGICQCGRCVCTNETFFGDACECDNISCERDNNGNICGGPGRGNCGCGGICTCVNGWSGSACDCTPDQSNCLLSALICSNRGMCECNECICDSEDFTGQFCQICTALECPDEPACLAYGDCVVCQFATQGSGGRNCDRICNITSLEETLQPGDPFDRGTYMIGGSTQTLACLTTEGDCTYRYFVGTSTSDQQPPIVFEGESCTEDSEFPAWIIIVIILGALLLLGILVLIGIRIFMELRYRYEYQQWLKEKENAKFGQQLNPLYTKATTDIDNPLYDQKKRQKQKEAEGAVSTM